MKGSQPLLTWCVQCAPPCHSGRATVRVHQVAYCTNCAEEKRSFESSCVWVLCGDMSEFSWKSKLTKILHNMMFSLLLPKQCCFLQLQPLNTLHSQRGEELTWLSHRDNHRESRETQNLYLLQCRAGPYINKKWSWSKLKTFSSQQSSVFNNLKYWFEVSVQEI